MFLVVFCVFGWCDELPPIEHHWVDTSPTWWCWLLVELVELWSILLTHFICRWQSMWSGKSGWHRYCIVLSECQLRDPVSTQTEWVQSPLGCSSHLNAGVINSHGYYRLCTIAPRPPRFSCGYWSAPHRGRLFGVGALKRKVRSVGDSSAVRVIGTSQGLCLEAPPLTRLDSDMWIATSGLVAIWECPALRVRGRWALAHQWEAWHWCSTTWERRVRCSDCYGSRRVELSHIM